MLKHYGSLLAALLCSASLMSCHLYKDTDDFVTLDREENPADAAPQTLSVHFLGTGGIYLQGEGVSLLGDPFFTNPLPWHWFSPFAVSSDAKLIDRELQRLPGIADLESVLVTHSHYDHAMDVSYISQHYFPLCIYGSETLRHAIGAVASFRVCSVEGRVTEYEQENPTWIKAGRQVRIAAIRSGHFNHLGNYFYGRGSYTEPPPGGEASRLYEWRVGETYSFVIDILNVPPLSGTVYRIFYMPSAASPPAGNIPVSIINDKTPVDLAIIGASQVDKDENYPGELLAQIKPRAVMMVHWDSFVERYKTRRLMNLGVDPDVIGARIKARLGDEVKIYWPMRGAVHELPLIGNE